MHYDVRAQRLLRVRSLALQESLATSLLLQLLLDDVSNQLFAVHLVDVYVECSVVRRIIKERFLARRMERTT